MKASENGHEEIVTILLTAGAKVDVQDWVNIISSFPSQGSSFTVPYVILPIVLYSDLFMSSMFVFWRAIGPHVSNLVCLFCFHIMCVVMSTILSIVSGVKMNYIQFQSAYRHLHV